MKPEKKCPAQLFAVYKSCIRVLHGVLIFSTLLFAELPDSSGSRVPQYRHALELRENGQYEHSSTIFIVLKAHYRQTGSADSSALCLLQIGRNLYLMRKYSPAIDSISLALPRLQEIHGEKHLHVALAQNYLASCYRLTKAYDKALSLYDRALATRQSLTGRLSPDVSIVYNNKALVFREQKKFSEALSYHQMALNGYLRSTVPDHKSIGTSYRFLGIVYTRMGDYQQAASSFEQALLHLTGNSKQELNERGRVLLLLGNNALITRNYQAGIDNYLQAEIIILKIYGKNHRRLGTIYHNLAILYSEIRNFPLSESYSKKTFVIYEQRFGLKHARVAYLLNSMGFAQAMQGDFEAGLANIEDALAMISPDNTLRIQITQTLAEVCALQGDHQRGIISADSAIAIEKRLLVPRSANLSQSYRIKGDIYRSQGMFDLALASYQQSLIATSSSFSSTDLADNPDFDQALGEAEMLEALIGKSLALYQKSVQVKPGSPESSDNLILALSCAEYASALVDRMRSGYRAESTRLIFGENVAAFFGLAIDIALDLWEKTGDQRYPESAFAFVEKSRAATLAEALSEAEARQFGNLPDSLREIERTLKIQLTQKESAYQKLRSKTKFEQTPAVLASQAELVALKTEYAVIIDRLEQEYPDYFNLKYQTGTVTLSELQDSLDPETAIISFALSEKELNTFVITSHGTEIVRTSTNRSLVSLANDFTRSLRLPSQRRFYPDYAFKLYQALILPIAPMIHNKKRLAIIPGEELAQIPFEALITEKPDDQRASVDYRKLPYLLQDFEVNYHYSATLLRAVFSDEGKAPNKLFGGFAPVFADSMTGRITSSELSISGTLNELWTEFTTRGGDNRSFKALPFSEGEVRNILDRFGGKDQRSTIYLRDQATKARFIAEARHYRYLHLATHSFVDLNNPRQSGIAFASADTSTANILYAPEIYNLQLNADLVVLSSCESGLGKIVAGEGLLAMTRGFLYAGVPNIVVSLWKVGDQATSSLMDGFYQGVAAGKPYTISLRKAKLKLIEDRQTAFPGFWSSFVLIGG